MRLGVEVRGRVARVGAAGQVDELEVHEAGAQDVDDRDEIVPEPVRIRGEGPVLAGDRLLQPHRLHLDRGCARVGDALVDVLPVGRGGIPDLLSVLPALRSVDDRHGRALRRIAVGVDLEARVLRRRVRHSDREQDDPPVDWVDEIAVLDSLREVRRGGSVQPVGIEAALKPLVGARAEVGQRDQPGERAAAVG